MCHTHVWVEPPARRMSAGKPLHNKVLAPIGTSNPCGWGLRDFKSVTLTNVFSFIFKLKTWNIICKIMSFFFHKWNSLGIWCFVLKFTLHDWWYNASAAGRSMMLAIRPETSRAHWSFLSIHTCSIDFWNGRILTGKTSWLRFLWLIFASLEQNMHLFLKSKTCVDLVKHLVDLLLLMSMQLALFLLWTKSLLSYDNTYVTVSFCTCCIYWLTPFVSKLDFWMVV